MLQRNVTFRDPYESAESWSGRVAVERRAQARRSGIEGSVGCPIENELGCRDWLESSSRDSVDVVGTRNGSGATAKGERVSPVRRSGKTRDGAGGLNG